MIVILKPSSYAKADLLAEAHQAISVVSVGFHCLVLRSSVTELPAELEAHCDRFINCDSDIQLASRLFVDRREVDLGFARIGGEQRNTVMMAGPCSVESEEQIRKAAELCVEQSVKMLRAGCFKPRTSPYSFQGMGEAGLKLLAKMRDAYGLKIITEIRDSTQADMVIEYADVIQIGAKSMYDHGVLRKCGASRKPVLLKRGFGSSLQEFVQSAEFILSGGNDQVILCERGIRSFETKSRFTLDLCGVAWLQEQVNLPIVLDPSHAMGYAYGVGSLARACVAMGVDGLLIETHPEPKKALSDASQQLDFDAFRKMMKECQAVAAAVGYQLI